MIRPLGVLLFLLPLMASGQEAFSGQSALELTSRIASFGPRPPGSAAAKKLQEFIITSLKGWGWTVEEDAFTAQTPAGRASLKNIIARKLGKPGSRILAVSGHYDTKRFPFKFVGANDGGSSTGILLELARSLRNTSYKHEIRLIFHDGEEAVREWTSTDSLYGSRHLSERWRSDGTLARMDALINVDMIGDRDLAIVREAYSSDALMRVIWQVASSLGYAKHFLGEPYAIEDDHVPYLRNGVRAANLIDFSYGPEHAWWHTTEDTIDKLSARSFEIVGRVLVETLRRLD